MTGERRDTPRVPIALDAIINYNDQNYRHSRTRNISLDGAFVESRNGELPKKGPIDLAIKLPVEGTHKYHRFHAQVVRATGNGAALLFDRVETDSYAALLDLVFTRRPQGPW